MWRKAACAASGLLLASAAAFGLHSIDTTATTAVSFDLRWLYPAAKGDRLPVTQVPASEQVVMAFSVPSENTTIAAKGKAVSAVEDGKARGIEHSAIQVPRMRVPLNPVRTVPNDEKQDVKQKDKLPEGCEPSFSPVTTPSLAHISGRCDA